MRITVRHLSTEITVDEAIDPSWKNNYETSHPTKLRGKDSAPYVLELLKAMSDEVIKMRKADISNATE
jgi:hypothetical protein